MSGEVEVKLRKKSGSSRSSRGSSFKTTGKGGKAEEESASSYSLLRGNSLAASASSQKEKMDASSSSYPKGNINATTITAPNTSYPSSQSHHLQKPPQPEKSVLQQTSSVGAVESGDGSNSAETATSSGFSSRLSLKSLRGRKSPVRTQFNLSNTQSSGEDQIPSDSISVLASTSTAGNTTSCITPSSSGINSEGAGCTSATKASLINNSDGASKCGRTSSFRGLSVKKSVKKERGASASPPQQRTQVPSEQSLPGTSSSPNKASEFNPSTNPIPGLNLSTKIETEPADSSIAFIPGTSAPISVDRVHSVKITKKILNWRSKTKDLIRRWKTLPENHSDFEKCPEESPTTSKKKVCSTSNLNNNTSGSPGLGKKNKSVKAGKSESEKVGLGISSRGSTLPNKNDSVKDIIIPVPSISNTPAAALTAASPLPPKNVQRSPELHTSSKPSSNNTSSGCGVAQTGSSITTTVNSTTTPRVSFQTQPSLPKDNEKIMPAIGAGKDGPGAGQGSGISGGGRLSTVGGLMTGIGRPSISVNNTSGLLNGRTGGASSGGGGGAGDRTSGSGAIPGSSSDQKSTWTVHVWTTYVQRDDLEQGLDVEEPKKPDREYLSDFQKVKLTHFFRHVLDMNHDDVISAEDFVALNQRIRHYIEWSPECIEFHILKEVHSGFLECFLNQPLDENSVMYYCSSERETRQHVNIDEWLDVWGGLLQNARTMESLPLWLQYFPKILFQVINKSGSGTISREELRAFYTMFMGIDFRVVNETLESIYKAMTDGGRHKITYDLFKLCFANFLLAKYPNGPGQYLFGIVNSQTLECSFPIDYSALNTPISDLEPYDPEKDKKAMTITRANAKAKPLKRY